MTDTPLTLVSDEKKPHRKGPRAPKRLSDADRDRIHAEAFRHQEGGLRELLSMSKHHL
jgi:hypothetical protein